MERFQYVISLRIPPSNNPRFESGAPTVRNKEAGHGQGSEPVNVPEYLAAYVLHLTASNIVLLVEAYKAKFSEQ